MDKLGQPERLNARERCIVGGIGSVMTAMPLLVGGICVYLFLSTSTPEANLRAYLQLVVETFTRGDVSKVLTMIAIPFLLLLFAGWTGVSTVCGMVGRQTTLGRAILAANDKIGLLELFCYCLAAVAIITGTALAFVGLPFIAIPLLLSGLVLIGITKLIFGNSVPATTQESPRVTQLRQEFRDRSRMEDGTIRRLVQYERKRTPAASDEECYRAAMERWERDHR